MADDALVITPDNEQALRQQMAALDAQRAREAAILAGKKLDDRAEGLAMIRAIFATKAYQDVRDRIMAVKDRFHDDAIVGQYFNMTAFEEWADKAR